MTLLSRLKACVPDERDIPLLLSMAAGGGERATRDGAIEYLSPGAQAQVFAKLRFKYGQIRQLLPGPGLKTQIAQDALVNRACHECAQNHGTFVSSRVLFSHIPLKGSFYWSDRFRITPPPRGARIGRSLDRFSTHRLPHQGDAHLGPPFPFVLEVRSFRTPNHVLEADRLLRDLDTYQHLLTLLLHGRIYYAHQVTERQWTSVKRRGRIQYHLLHQGFDTGLAGRTDGFSQRHLRPAPTYVGPDYYNHLWGQDAELQIPDGAAHDLETFDTLSLGLKRRFSRACYWYALGVQFTTEPSLSTVAFSSAIECLLPRQHESPCDTCGKPLGPGPTKLFIEHLRKYAVVPPSLHLQRDAIYGVRSALVHGSHAARTDEGFFGHGRPFVDPLLIELVAQRSLLSWLRDPNRRE